MKRRTFLAAMLAAPVAVKAAPMLAAAARAPVAVENVRAVQGVAGVILECGPLVETVTTERQGKGGGPLVDSYHYTRSYTIRAGGPECEVLTISRDGKVVYDRTGKFKPDPTESEAFRQRTRYAERYPNNFTVHNDDLTPTQGRIPEYQFHVRKRFA